MPPARDATGHPQPLAGLRMLVVEDDPDAITLFQMVLEGLGAAVQTADNAEDALRIMEVTPPEVVLSDIGLPKRDGLWFARQSRRRWPDIPLVGITAFSQRALKPHAIAAGFEALLAKPLDIDSLVRVLARVRGGGRSGGKRASLRSA